MHKLLDEKTVECASHIDIIADPGPVGRQRDQHIYAHFNCIIILIKRVQLQ